VRRSNPNEALREAVPEYLQTRFGELPPDVRERIDAVQKPDKMKQLNRVTWQSDSLDEFRKAL
jgi:hypothetical protein